MITPESGKQYSDEDVLEVKQITGKGEVNDIYSPRKSNLPLLFIFYSG